MSGIPRIPIFPCGRAAAALLLFLASGAPGADIKESSLVFSRPVTFKENGNVRPLGRIFTNLTYDKIYPFPAYGVFAVRNAAGDVVAALVDNHILLMGNLHQNQNAFPGRLKFKRANGTVIASFSDDGSLYVDNVVENVTSCAVPVWEPTKWNNTEVIQYGNNCYNYANNQVTQTFAQPGRASGAPMAVNSVTAVRAAAISDGLIWVGWNFPGNAYTCAGAGTLVYMAVDPGNDYHWYRLDKAAGKWTHKLATAEASDKDASGNLIANPSIANRNYPGGPGAVNYTDNGGYYCTCGSDANVY